jgi:hypothetical protein
MPSGTPPVSCARAGTEQNVESKRRKMIFEKYFMLIKISTQKSRDAKLKEKSTFILYASASLRFNKN